MCVTFFSISSNRPNARTKGEGVVVGHLACYMEKGSVYASGLYCIRWLYFSEDNNQSNTTTEDELFGASMALGRASHCVENAKLPVK